MTQVGHTPEDGAVYWFMREKNSALSQQESVERDAWLALDDANREAYRRTRALWDELRDLAADAPMRELRREALEARPVKQRMSVHWTVGAAVASLGAVAAIAFFVGDDSRLASPIAPEVKHYQTAIGERSTIALTDGSTIILNTASDASVRFGQNERTVELTSGQAYFAVAADKTRPFVVVVGNRRVTALGTAFDVRVDQDQVQVVLVEGKVTIANAGNPGSQVELEPGERFVSGGEALGKVAATNVETSTSWRAGRLVFNDTSLGDAVAEINRYRTRPILIGDASVAELKISGTYRVSEASRFPEALVAYYPVEWLERPSGDGVLVMREKN